MIKYLYDAWGNHEIITDTDEIASINPYRYRSYYYDSRTGRFINQDDIMYLDSSKVNGLNLYSYCMNNPIMMIDPNGCDPWSDFWNGVGSFFSGLFSPVTDTFNSIVKNAGTILGNTLMVIGGSLLALAGAVTTISALPIGLTVPGGGFLLQLGFSEMMYGAFMVGSVFDNQIKADMNAIGWNPFNDDPTHILTGKGAQVSFYKGMPVAWVNHSSGRSGSFLGIWLSGYNNIDTMKHEWGHGIQQGIMGALRYGLMVGLPSPFNWGQHKWGQSDYYIRPWEAGADMFGGVASHIGYNKRNSNDESAAIWYLIISTLFGPFGYLFLI